MFIDENIIFFIIYPATKFVFYVFWCAIGLYILTNKYSLTLAIKLGLLRWFLGLGFGVIVFLFFPLDLRENAQSYYITIYTPLRVIEWGIISSQIESVEDNKSNKIYTTRSVLWILGGIIVSYATDLASPEGFEGRFCVGRCLC